MKQQAAKEPQRASREFWAIDDFWQIKLVTAYECPPSQDVWWVPELGYSLSVRHHLFENAVDARDMAIKKVESNIADLQAALASLKALPDATEVKD